MGNKEILSIVEIMSNEKDVGKEVIFEAIEAALAAATRKLSHEDINVRVEIDRKSGQYDTFRYWVVVDENALDEEGNPVELVPSREIALSAHLEKHPDAVAGDTIEESMPSIEFGRIAAQTAKQVILQKVREAERLKIADAYLERVGELISGTVKRATHEGVVIELGGGSEGMIPRSEMLPREVFRPGDRVRAYLKDVQKDARGPQVLMSRACNEMLVSLFKIEVPEVGEELIEIKSVARDPGSRAKIAVKSNDKRLDPQGACIGMRGARVQAVSNELSGERVDIVLWHDDPVQFVINAMSPVDVQSIVVDEQTNSMDVAVSEEQLSQAIGRSGQNVRLASQLTGWSLNVLSSEQAERAAEAEGERLKNLFIEALDVESEVADLLIEEGFSSLEEVAYVPLQEMLEIEALDEESIQLLRERAKDALTSGMGKGSSTQPAEDLLSMDGMTDELAHTLAQQGIITMEDLAEQSIDDLRDVAELEEAKAAELIMTARAPWFADQGVN